MFIINAFFVRPTETSCISDPSLNAEIYSEQLYLWKTLSWTHIMCAGLMTVMRSARPGLFIFANAALTVINLVQLVTLVFASQYMIEQAMLKSNEFTEVYKQFNFWCTVEIGIMATTIMSNAIFLFLRSMFGQKFYLKVPALLQNDDTDFLVSQQVLLGFMVSFCAPNYLTTIYFKTGFI
jgi:hypothetical protein